MTHTQTSIPTYTYSTLCIVCELIKVKGKDYIKTFVINNAAYFLLVKPAAASFSLRIKDFSMDGDEIKGKENKETKIRESDWE